MRNSKYIEIEKEKISHLLNDKLILIVTATDLETKFAHEQFAPLDEYGKILKIYVGPHTYYLALLGNYLVIHVQCSMGSLSRDSSIMTLNATLKVFECKIVIMVGLAFGVDDKKQKIGDVLVSESVIPYNSKRVGKEQTIQRGIEAPSSKILLNRFKNIKTTWEHILPDGSKANLIPTRLLSGEELIDNLEYRNELIKENPDSEGGEMEGAGVYAACDSSAQWLLVKGVCDFGDGQKGKNKKQNQTTAVLSALSACKIIFDSNSAFKELGIEPFLQVGLADTKINLKNLNDVLFDFYDEGKEKYYIKREKDDDFNRILKQYGIWIFGPSGCGKSNLIVRNLSLGEIEFIQINLAPCIGQDVESFFKEILYELSSKVEGVNSQIQPKNFTECSKALINLLDKHYKNKELIIFIEEIPIGSEKVYKEFAEKIFSLIISKIFVSGLGKIKFILSSIESPLPFIQVIQHKIHQQINFLSLEYWHDEEISELIDLIIVEFKIPLTKEFKNSLVISAKGSPRFVKKFFRSISTLEKSDEKTLQFVLRDTERELSSY